MSDRAVSTAPDVPRRDGPTLGEEIVHAATHGVGALLSLVVLFLLVAHAAAHGTTSNVVSAAVFGASLVLVYGSSTAYHAVRPHWVRTKAALQILDHAAIHLLIAGTATPIILAAFAGQGGWISAGVVRAADPTQLYRPSELGTPAVIALGVMWSLSLFGVIVETTPLRAYTRLSIGVYLGNGWVGALALPTLYGALSSWALSCLLLGGVAYTAGVPFFLAHRRKWMHAWWHAFVLAGSGLHVAAVALCLVS